MKKIIPFFIVLSILTVSMQIVEASEETKSQDPKHPFYRGNLLYEKGDYSGAIGEYNKILDSGFESGNLCYNIGNAYFKLGKLGFAILYYERARRFMPGDPDLSSNLKYARSLVEGSEGVLPAPWWSRFLERISGNLSLTTLAVSLSLLYFLDSLLLVFFIIVPRARKKLSVAVYIVTVFFLLEAASFGHRFYFTEKLRPSVVTAREADGKFEPFDKATTFFKLYEGDTVYILKTKDRWSYVMRRDGKKGWIERDLYEEI